MQKTEEETVAGDTPWAVRWHRLRSAYRVCNQASHHVLGFTIKLVLLLYFSFVVLFLALRYAVLPNIDQGDVGGVTNTRGISYQVYFAQAGSYRVWVRGRNDTMADDTVWVGVDGAAPVSSRATAAAHVLACEFAAKADFGIAPAMAASPTT